MPLPECVWLLRHAETTQPHVINGAESDVPLSLRGQQQAQAITEWFREHDATRVVSSRMNRAVATAQIIAGALQLPHTVEPQLHERRVGPLSGKSFDEYKLPWEETLSQWEMGNTEYSTPGAESYADMVDRLIPAWQRVMQANAGERVIVVAHGIVCKVLLLELLDGWSVEDWRKLGRVENLSVSELIPHTSSRWTAPKLLYWPDEVAQVC